MGNNSQLSNCLFKMTMECQQIHRINEIVNNYQSITGLKFNGDVSLAIHILVKNL